MPKNSSFVHLHVHAENSTLDGLARTGELVNRAAELGMPAIAVTDHGTMAGTYDLYKTAKAHGGVKGILGIEAYVAPGVPRQHKAPVRWAEGGDADVSGAGAYLHQTLLAADDTGLRNLMKLSSEAYLTGFYRKPRMDFDLLAEHSKGVIATSGCPSGEIQTWLRIGDYDKALAAAAKYRDMFDPGNFFIEVMDHGLEIERQVIPDLIRIGKDLNLPFVATNDLHYTKASDWSLHDALLCVGSGSKIADEKRFRFDAHDFYLKSAEEMRALWDDVLPDACDNTLLIAERCEVHFEPKNLMPQFPVPAGETADSWLRKEVRRGLERRYPAGIPQDRLDREEEELGVICSLGFADYFLVVADFIAWARSNGVLVGPGRGSAAGSLVAYALEITQLDPVQYKLYFARFLNVARATGADASPPDIDIDFDDRGRGRVIEYVTHKYGQDKVVGLVTSMQMKAKAAIKDSARVLGHPYMLGEQLTKVYPKPIVGRDLSLADAYNPDNDRYDEAKEFRDKAASQPELQEIVGLARGLEGAKRGFGQHAAGVVMSSEPISDYVPLMKKDGNEASPVITQYEYYTCEKLGLLKMDFLGLSNLGTISEALLQIQNNRGVDVSLKELTANPTDPKTYELLARGDSLGVFQLDSGPMRALLKHMNTDSFEDISAILALYRPGPLAAGTPNMYADRKNGRAKVVPIHPELAEPLGDILGETYGLITYQEQVMAIAQAVAGYSMEQADLLRRAMGKKKKEVIDAEFVGFAAGMRANDFSDDCIEALWAVLVPFSDYAFNRAHSAAYGMVSYWTAYLKANFPVEYMSALLTTNAGNKDKLALYLGECRAMGIKVLPPDVNSSELNYTAVGGDIRTGLIGVKGVGEGVLSAWLVERGMNGPARGLGDFLMRVDAGLAQKRAVAALIQAGAFDSFGFARSALWYVHEDACELARKAKKASGGVSVASLFDELEPEFSDLVIDVPVMVEWEQSDKLAREREVLGLYVSGHPLADYSEAIAALSSHPIALLRDAEQPPSEQVKIAGLVSSVVKKTTKASGEPWAIVTVEDLDSSMEVLVFPRTYAEVADLLVQDAILAFSGRVEKKDDGSTSFMVRDVSAPDVKAAQRRAERALAKAAAAAEAVGDGVVVDEAAVLAKVDGPTAGHVDDGRTDPVVVSVLEVELTEPAVVAFRHICEEFAGSRPVRLRVLRADGGVAVMALPDALRVVGSAQFAAEVRALFGAEAV